VNLVIDGRCRTGPCSLNVWQCAALCHHDEEFVHCSYAVVAAVAEGWEHETRRRKGSYHAYFGLYNQKMGWSKEQMNQPSEGSQVLLHDPRGLHRCDRRC